jgi:transposase
LKGRKQEVVEALKGEVEAHHRHLIGMVLHQIATLDADIASLDRQAAEAMRAHPDVIDRLSQIPGIGPQAALQIIAEIGAGASAFASASKLASWIGVCPGRNESAEQSYSERSAKGNRPMRRLLAQAANAAVNKKQCIIGLRFRQLLPRLGWHKAVWAIAHQLCRIIWRIVHVGAQYIERFAAPPDEKLRKKRKERLVTELRKLGYAVQLTDHTVLGQAPHRAS